MAALLCGIFDTLAPEQGADLGAAYEQHIADAAIFEELGFAYYFFIEHQNARFPVIASPAPYLAAVARATKTLKIGAMVFQLPMHHPVRLAQDAAMVDQLSNGRLQFGIGYGTQAREFDGWGLDFGQRRSYGYEAMDVILKAWTQTEFSHEGKHFRFNGAKPQPHPKQKPYPAVWMGGHSDASINYAADMNFNFAQNLDVERTIAEKFERFRTAWAKRGHAGLAPLTLLARHVHVAPTDEQALAEAGPYMLQGIPGQAGVARALALREEEKTPEMLEIARVYVESAKSVDFWLDEGLAFVGSPQTVAAKIGEQQRLCGYDILLTHHQITTMPHALSRSSAMLFGKEVIPALGAVPAAAV